MKKNRQMHPGNILRMQVYERLDNLPFEDIETYSEMQAGDIWEDIRIAGISRNKGMRYVTDWFTTKGGYNEFLAHQKGRHSNTSSRGERRHPEENRETDGGSS